MVRCIWCVLQWLWRTGLGFLRSVYGYIKRCFSRVHAFVHLALRWTNACERPDDPEFSNDNNLEVPRSSPEEAEDDQREVPAGSVQQPAYEQQSSAENDYDDADFDGEEYRVDTADDLYCDYDSTWETEDHQKNTSRETRGPSVSLRVSKSKSRLSLCFT